jgi:hypothetical protein
MSKIGSYKNTAFSESQKFLVLDPSTGSTSLVLGSDLVAYITPQIGSVKAESTRLSAENTDYKVGEIIQTSGATVVGSLASVYLVVAGGAGDFPMLNGNDLLVLIGDDALRAQLISQAAGQGASRVSMEGGPTVEAAVTAAEADILNRVIRVSSRTEMKAYDVPAGYQFSLEEGGRSGLFIVKIGSPPSDTEEAIYIVLTNGNYAERIGSDLGRVQAVWYGLLGDSSDELTKLSSLAAYATDKKRGVDFEPNKTYKYSDFVSFFDAGVLDFKNSLVIFEHSGNSTGLQLKGQTGIRNSRHQNNGTPSGVLGPAGQRDIVALDVHDTEFTNIKFVSGSNNYAPFNILGNSYNLDIDQIEFESAQWDMGCICHWATVSDSAATDYSADIAFAAGGGNATTHPHNIIVNNLKGGTYTAAGALVSHLFLSGCYNIFGVNIRATSVNRISTVIAGDYANAFSSIAESRFIGSGIMLNNLSCNQITGSEGVIVSGAGQLTASVLKMEVLINNPKIRSTLGGTTYGIRVDNISAVKVNGGSVLGFSRSIFGQRNVHGFTAENTIISESTTGGVLFDSDDETNTNIILRGLKVHSNNTSSSAALSASGIVIRATNGAQIESCFFGVDGSAEGQQHSVYVEDGCDNITLTGNHTYSSAQTSAYSGELVTQYSMKLWDGGGNTTETAFSFKPDAHVWFKALGVGYRSGYLNSNDTAPTTGTWVAGEEVIFRRPGASGHRGAICVTGGTPGTWKKFGAIEA